MKRSMIALLGAAAMTVAIGGYAVGVTRHDTGSERSASCARTGRDFADRAAQLRKQLRETDGDETALTARAAFATTRVKILSAVVVQNPACFDAGTRATASFLRQHPAEDEKEAATCDLVGVAVKDCYVSEG
ncbi:hypothetical protein [Streptomyces sp. NPDC052192]|uniref:hypothetical protein n=1 Tax=Streptomyces sp. NPDC052192 TaxID=3155052 RepID=UPI0034370FB8